MNTINLKHWPAVPVQNVENAGDPGADIFASLEFVTDFTVNRIKLKGFNLGRAWLKRNWYDYKADEIQAELTREAAEGPDPLNENEAKAAAFIAMAYILDNH